MSTSETPPRGYTASKDQLLARLARIEGQIAFATLLRRFPGLRIQPAPITWRQNMGLRGLTALRVAF